MAAATTQLTTPGRGPSPFINLSAIQLQIVATATAYATATGGLPFDLTTALQQAAPSGWDAPYGIQAINPADIVGALFTQLTTSGFLPQSLVVGTPTYTAVPWQSDNGIQSEPGYLATCPTTIRLFGTGSANHAALGEIADGNVTDTITILLLINRNGANN